VKLDRIPAWCASAAFAACAASAFAACSPAAPRETTAIAVPPPVDASAPTATLDAEAADASPPPVADARRFEELLAKLGDPPLDGDRETFRLKQLFDQLRALADPRAADGLARYLATSPPPRWRTQAAFALAELGDVRAVDTLAWRLRQDPLKLYSDADAPELRRDDNERVVAARLLADLVLIHPGKREAIANAAEEAMLAWANGQPAPHANAMRFLARVGSARGVAKLRAWADPPDKVPPPGANAAFPIAFSVAQSALRHLGAAQKVATKRDEAAWALLKRQLERRPASIDVSMDVLSRGGTVVRGMTYRSLAVGAAEGFAEWGDAKAFALLRAHAEEPKNNEQSRIAACVGMALVGTDADLASLVAKVKSSDPKKAYERLCYLEALRRRAWSGSGALVDLVGATNDESVRIAAALAVGKHGVDAATQAKLVQLLGDGGARVAAALALLLGGDERMAAHAVAIIDGAGDAERERLQVEYIGAFDAVDDRAYDDGLVARWIANARACAAEWPKLVLARQLRSIENEHGPRTLTRVVLRARLYADAKGSDAKKRDVALVVLEMLGEEAGAAGVRAADRQSR